MERVVFDLSKIISNEKNYFLCDGKNDVVSIPNDTDINLLIANLKPCANIVFNVGKNVHLELSILAEESLEKANIHFEIDESSSVYVHFADFSINKNEINADANINGEGSEFYWHLASLSRKEDNKKFYISCNHNSPRTTAKIDNYGVCKDEGKLLFSGTSYIHKGSIKSLTNQNAKIMVFDRLSNAIAKPILKIDENDISANHAAVVGKINDEHLFYLTSRGIPEETAKELITFGYLKPILNGFIDEEMKEKIASLIERS